VVIDGVDITGLNEDALALVRGRKIGFVFQSYQLIPTLSAEENVLLPLPDAPIIATNCPAGSSRSTPRRISTRCVPVSMVFVRPVA
jgi:predicted ABC-type transport system involved in lysophospholipase L1 biosynthesis ATPase subunit